MRPICDIPDDDDYDFHEYPKPIPKLKTLKEAFSDHTQRFIETIVQKEANILAVTPDFIVEEHYKDSYLKRICILESKLIEKDRELDLLKRK